MLTGKQKRYLRALVSKEKALFQIGKEGISDNLINTIKGALKKRELVKISVLKTCDLEMNEIYIEILSRTSSELVSKIGRTFSIYKAAKEPKIVLPK